MCGIAGEFRFDMEKPSMDILADINTVQSKRGPDGSGLAGDCDFGFAHTRLSIIDLSDKSSQPMTDKKTTWP